MNLIPVLIILVLSMILLGQDISDHGKPGGKIHGGWALAHVVLWTILYWWAGFYRTFGAPQFIWIALQALGLSIAVRRHGEKDLDVDAPFRAVGIAILLLLLYWGLQ